MASSWISMGRGRSLGQSSAFLLIGLLGAACASRQPGCAGDFCGTLLIAAVGEPVSLLPPLAESALERDISDQLFLKLADIGVDQNTIGDGGFEPQLADRWTWIDSLTVAFHLHPNARWHDGRPVTARDVEFSFAAYRDTMLGSPVGPSLDRIASVTAGDSATAVIRFTERYPEMFFDAVYHVRILPEHLMRGIPVREWRGTALGRVPVGNGPYRFARWTAGESAELVADSAFFLGRPHIRRVIWRFTSDLAAAVTQLLAGEADAVDALVTPPNVDRAKAAPHLALYPYAGTAYSLLGFNLHRRGTKTALHPVLSDVAVRRAIMLGTDRIKMAQSVFGDNAKVPPAPIPQAWKGLWFPDLAVPPFNPDSAARLLQAAGWRDTDGDGLRERSGQRLRFAIVVPTTSAARRQYARLIQEQLRTIGMDIAIDEVEPPALQSAVRGGQFDAVLETWATDPTPNAGLADRWRRNGATNAGGYANAELERDLDRAARAVDPTSAAEALRSAFNVLANDVAAVVLNAPDAVAAVHRRVQNVQVRADSYWALLRTWKIDPKQLLDRDRVAE